MEETVEKQQKAEPVIKVKDLYKIYRVGEERVRALNGVSFTINGEISVPSWAPPVPVNPHF